MSPAQLGDWLTKRRKAAAKELKSLKLPTSDEEVWRYSDIDELDMDAYRIMGIMENAEARTPLMHAPGANDLIPKMQEELGELSCLLVCLDGYFIDAWQSSDFKKSGAYAGPLKNLDKKNPQKYLGMAMHKPLDYFAALNDAYMADPLIVNIPDGVQLDLPVGILELADSDGACSFSRLIVNAEQNSAAKVVHIFRSSARDNLVVPVVELALQQASNLAYLSVEDLGHSDRQISAQVAEVNSQANLSINNIRLGGGSVRSRTECKLEGRGASGDILSLYFANADQKFDFRTYQKHSAPDTSSNLLFKGAVDERARLIYSGLIKIAPDASSSNAIQANHNLKLSEDAWVESVPNLEIENNDVVCAHASTVGPVDEDQLFYLQSRGISEEEAEKLIVAGFFKEALSRMPFPDAIPTLYDRLVSKFTESSHFALSREGKND